MEPKVADHVGPELEHAHQHQREREESGRSDGAEREYIADWGWEGRKFN